MKGDFSRRGYKAEKHYRSVLMQQGRVQLDADWNEQGDILLHRLDTETADLIGGCGGPLHQAGFHVVTSAAGLSPDDLALPGNASPPAPGAGNFLISAGRYYVDGLLAENEKIVTYLTQPDLPEAPALGGNGNYLVYIDVWERHITALDDPSLREVALGGP